MSSKGDWGSRPPQGPGKGSFENSPQGPIDISESLIPYDPQAILSRMHLGPLTAKHTQLKLLDPWSKDAYGSLLKVSGSESISNLFEYNLTVVTEKADIADKTFCNKELSFVVQTTSDNGQNPKEERYYHGIIKAVSFWQGYYGDMNVYQIMLVPKLYHTTQIRRTRVFSKEGQIIADVIKAVLDEYQIKYKFELEGEALFAAETCVQFNETDFSFLMRIMSQAGFFYFFQHDKDKHEMVISNHPKSYFAVELNQEEPRWGLKDLRMQHNSYVKDFEIKVFNYEKPLELIEDQFAATGHDKQEAVPVKAQRVLSMQKVEYKAEVKNIICNYAKDLNNVPESISGSSGYKNLAVCGSCKLTFLGSSNKKVVKECVVVSLNLSVDDIEGTYINDFIAIPKDCVIAPIAQKKNFLGMHSAVVVNKEQSEGEEPFVDKKGQVYTYVKMHWETETICRALVITPFNTVNVPKPGALVQVGFLQNESYSDIPFVWGMHPPKIEELLDYDNAEHNVLSLYAAYHSTVEKEIFNSILFKDKKEEQEIELRAKKDQYSYIGGRRQSFIGYDKREEVPEKEETDKESLLIKEGNRRERICQGNDVLNLDEGNITTTIKKGEYALSVNEEDLLIKMDKEGYSLICKKKVTIKADDDVTVHSKKNITIEADGEITMKAGKGFNFSSPKDLSISVNNMNAATQGAHKVDAMSVNHSAKQGVAVKAGTELNAEGGIGATLKGGATATVEGGGMTEIKGGMVKVN